MPIYVYKCSKCGQIHEDFRKMEDRKEGPECCGEKTRQHYGNYHVIGDIKPYLDENISDKPVWVKSRQHREQLIKENKVVELYGKNWV